MFLPTVCTLLTLFACGTGKYYFLLVHKTRHYLALLHFSPLSLILQIEIVQKGRSFRLVIEKSFSSKQFYFFGLDNMWFKLSRIRMVLFIEHVLGFFSTLKISTLLSFRDGVLLLHGRRQDAKWTLIRRVPYTYPSTDTIQNGLIIHTKVLVQVLYSSQLYMRAGACKEALCFFGCLGGESFRFLFPLFLRVDIVLTEENCYI